MNFNNSKYDFRRNKVLIAKGIEQAWSRRFFDKIYSGVRVKIQRKNSSFIEPVQQHTHHDLKLSSSQQTNPMQTIESKILKTIPHSSQMRSILHNTCLDKNMSSIGIQTTLIVQVDRQTSCNIIVPTTTLIKKSLFSSSSSATETSVSDEKSTQTNSTSTETSTVSGTTADTSESDDHHARYQRNNNAINTDVEQTNHHVKKWKKQ
jgi:hypothetical protein